MSFQPYREKVADAVAAAKRETFSLGRLKRDNDRDNPVAANKLKIEIGDKCDLGSSHCYSTTAGSRIGLRVIVPVLHCCKFALWTIDRADARQLAVDEKPKRLMPQPSRSKNKRQGLRTAIRKSKNTTV